MNIDWSSAPIRSEWGAGMLVADVELSKDATLTLYAHTDEKHLVPDALRKLVDESALPPPESIAATLLLERALKEKGLPMLCMREARIGYAAAYHWLGLGLT